MSQKTFENMTDAERLARIFHQTYERLAPQFGYETRQETREFDPESPNGRLMTAVCGEILAQLVPAAKHHALAEAVGQQADTLDNLLAATLLPMPPAFHLAQVRDGVNDVSAQLKALSTGALGYRPWASIEEMVEGVE
ncbi:MAG: hypothetical protein H6661_10175 [Ardenticatenaceae bacterium]|mgnify:CR=1 FL=1|nr:hypothetical protein [Ardenticatenaceae bacterium]